MTLVIPTKEQDIYSFMNRSFFPPWKRIENTLQLSELVSCFFMGGVSESSITPQKNREENGDKNMDKNGDKNGVKKREEKREEKDISLDWRYWAFWTAWISFHGLEEYHKIPETQKFDVWIGEKTKMSDWFQEHFLLAKKEIAKKWDKMTNLDMEESITGLVTDANEQESGLKTLLLCWTYYSMTRNSEESEFGKGAMECIWVVPGKSLYYSFSHGLESSPSEKWGVFMDLLEPRDEGGRGKPIIEGAPPRKPVKKQRRFFFRALKEGEVESIRNTMIELKAVNRSLAAISKYPLKDLVEMGEKIGLRPPMLSVVDEKGAMKLDLAEKVREAERELGVVRKAEEKKVLKKELEKVEKWKKGDWYERLEEYCLEIF